jgi:hypothetical protein
MRLMNLSLLLTVPFTLLLTSLQGQSVGIGTATPAAGAALDVVSTNKGILIPRVETSSVTSPVDGLLVFQPSNQSFFFYTGGTWKSLGGVIDSDGDTKVEAINQVGNDEISFTLDGVGKLILTRNASGDLQIQPLNLASASTYLGWQAGLNNTGSFNTGMGSWALQNTTSGSSNTGVGANALNVNSIGGNNTAVGQAALIFNSSGNNNVALGQNAMRANTSGSSNVAIGREALAKNTTREQLVAVGDSALHNNQLNAMTSIDGIQNTAVGSKAMLSNTTGRWNAALGYHAMKANTSGVNNTALGHEAMLKQTTGSANTAVGTAALWAHLMGDANTAVGNGAIGNNQTGGSNIGLGWRSGYNNLTGSNNIFIGTQAGYNETGSNRLYIENSATNGDSSLIYGEFDQNLLRANAHVQVNTYAPGHDGVRSIINPPANTATDHAGVYGENASRDYYGFGVYGKGGWVGVKGVANGTGPNEYFGVIGEALGVHGGTNYAVHGTASGGLRNYAGYFLGTGYFSENLGLGIDQPTKALHIYKDNDPTLLLQSNGIDELSGRVSMRQSDLTGADIFFDGQLTANALVIETFTGGTSNGRKMTMDLNGNVGIGITENIAADHKLSVNGKIACTEVRVQPQSAWPDYVFDTDYPLLPIEDLSNAISTHGHLPGIPSAVEIEANGLQVGEMQAMMMEKIEELTLYIIDLQKQIQALKDQH